MSRYADVHGCITSLRVDCASPGRSPCRASREPSPVAGGFPCAAVPGIPIYVYRLHGAKRLRGTHMHSGQNEACRVAQMLGYEARSVNVPLPDTTCTPSVNPNHLR